MNDDDDVTACRITRYVDRIAGKAVVDVRDVAEAHVAAIEKGTAEGKRVLLIAGNPHWAEVAGYVRHALPAGQKGNVPTQVSSELGAAALGAPPPLPTLYDAS